MPAVGHMKSLRPPTAPHPFRAAEDPVLSGKRWEEVVIPVAAVVTTEEHVFAAKAPVPVVIVTGPCAPPPPLKVQVVDAQLTPEPVKVKAPVVELIEDTPEDPLAAADGMDPRRSASKRVPVAGLPPANPP